PVQVQQIRHESQQLARVAGDPADEVSLDLWIELDVLTLQRQRAPEQGGERRSEVMRDGLEERVLQLIERTEPGGGFTFDVQCASEVLLRLLQGRDVEHHARPETG